MLSIHRRLRALAFLFVLSPLVSVQPAHANPTAADRGLPGGAPAKKVRPGGDSGTRFGSKGDDDCTRTLGYWKNHSAHADNPSQQIPWPISEETQLCGQTWFDILHVSPQGEAWIILAHQWIPAKLNAASGASTGVLGGTLDEAEDLLNDNCSSLSGDARTRGLELADLFDDYNNGRIGPPHCGDDQGTDCNGNGIDDSLDIENGTSSDSNQNGIPDECEGSIKEECIGSGVENGGVDCPCGNTVPPGATSGCINSTGQGASLTGTGLPLVSHDTLLLTANNLPAGKVSYFLFGRVHGPSVPFGDGTRCIGGPFQRVRKVAASTGSETFPPPNSLPISQQLGIENGEVVFFQVIYRDGSGPCHNGANATNLLSIRYGP